MKYCSSCGAQAYDSALLCPYCGKSFSGKTVQHDYNQNNSYNQNIGDTSKEMSNIDTLGYVAIFVGLFVSPLVGFICGGIGYSKASKIGYQKGKTLNIVGILVGGVLPMIPSVIIFITVFAMLLSWF